MADYLNITEIESAVDALAAGYPELVEVVELPHATHEGRTVRALFVRAPPPEPSRDLHGGFTRVLVVANQHAREWGTTDTVLAFVADLLDAYVHDAGVAWAGKSFDATDVAGVLERAGLIVLPCANPDGRNHSQVGARGKSVKQALWRGNRNPKGAVDLNRNYDIVWDFERCFASGLHSSLASADPAAETYHGTAPLSEPESRNVASLIRTQEPQYVLDVHSWGPRFLYPWAIDDHQSSDPEMAFWNSQYDGQRGVEGDAYREYLPEEMREHARLLAKAAVDAMLEAIPYSAEFDWRETPSVHFNKDTFTWFPTSGALDDYATSQSREGPGHRRLSLGFTMETSTGSYPANESKFHPLWPLQAERIPQYEAGLMAFCLAAIPAFARVDIVIDRDWPPRIEDLLDPPHPDWGPAIEAGESLAAQLRPAIPPAPDMERVRIGL